MPNNGLAYHVIIHALEASSGWTAQSRFAAAVTHTVNGHVPYERYHAASRSRKRERTGAETIERLIRDWLSTDLNPVIQIARSMNQATKAIGVYNVYNDSPILAASSVAAPDSELTSRNSIPIVEKRNPPDGHENPELFHLGSFFILNSVVELVARNEKEMLTPKMFSLTDVANSLGVSNSASAEVAAIFEMEGYIPVGEVARKLSCHQRTLERRLREEGLTAEAIRMATRLIRATKRIRDSDSLTSIAMEEGFSDQAQMTRVFRSSCGITPSMLRMLG